MFEEKKERKKEGKNHRSELLEEIEFALVLTRG